MKKRKIQLAVVLCILLIITILVGGCKQTETEKLRICFDVGSIVDMESGTSWQQEYVELFLRSLDSNTATGGISSDEVEIEMIPSDESLSTERSATLQRIRTEIMTGGGPDVFICALDMQCDRAVYDDRLFPYVEKAMEDGLFLPLDDYLDKFNYSPWDELNRNVMDGGKNRKGQQVLLPMAYTLPMLSFYQDDVSPNDFTSATWDDVLSGEDPALAEQVRWFWSLWGDPDDLRGDYHETGIGLIFPEMVNLEDGTLGFTEEELLNRVQKSLSAYHRLVSRKTQAINLNSVFYYDTRWESFLNMTTKDLSMIPLRNQNGGTTAIVVQYCAINRNTSRIQDAVSIVDFLLSEGIWRNGSGIYHYPVNQRVLIERNTESGSESFYTSTGLTENSFQEFLKAVDQVNAVRMPSRLDYTLNDMILEIQETMGKAHVDIADDSLYAQRADFILGDISDEELAEIVHKYYKKLSRLVDES